MKSTIKKILFVLSILLVVGALITWYLYDKPFADTKQQQADYTMGATTLIKAFEKNDSAANQQYAEKILVVQGRVTEIEAADTTINIKMADTTSGSYVIFAFQQQHLAEAKKIKEGDQVSIKGSCSGGAFSEILGAEFITFKRCAINN